MAEEILKQIAQHNPEYLNQLRNRARSKGSYPFIHMRTETYRWLQDHYDRWVLDLMKEHLKTEIVVSSWAKHFAEVMVILGRKHCCQAAKNQKLLQTVTRHPAWRGLRRAKKTPQLLPAGKDHSLDSRLRQTS